MSFGTENIEAFLRLHGVQEYQRDTKKAGKATQDFAEKSEKSVGKSAGAWVALGTVAGMALNQVGSAVSQMIRQFGRAELHLGHAMAEVHSLVDISRDKLSELTSEIRRMPMEVYRPSQELASGLYQLYSNAVQVGEGMGALRLAGKAASAGVTDVETTVRAGLQTIRAYGMEMESLEDIYDIQFATVKTGVLRYQELAHSVQNVISTAALVQMPLEDLYGTIAFLTTQSQAADIATTNLNAAILALLDNKDKLAEIGVQVFDTAGGFRRWADIMQELKVATAGTTKEQYELLASVGLTERRAFRAIGPGLKAYDQLEKKIGDVTDQHGAMAKAAEKATADAQSAYSRLAEVLKGEVGRASGGILEWGAGVADKIAEVVSLSSRKSEFGKVLRYAERAIGDQERIAAHSVGAFRYVPPVPDNSLAALSRYVEVLNEVFDLQMERPAFLECLGLDVPDRGAIKDLLRLLEIRRDELKALADVARSMPEDSIRPEAGVRPDLSALANPPEAPDAQLTAPSWLRPRFHWLDEAPPLEDKLDDWGAEQETFLKRLESSADYSFQEFSSTVLFHANLAGDAWHDMLERMRGDLAAFLARKAFTAFFGWIGRAISMAVPIPGGGAGGEIDIMSSMGMPAGPDEGGGPTVNPAAMQASGTPLSVAIYEATPATWVEVTNRHIAPAYERAKRKLIAERR